MNSRLDSMIEEALSNNGAKCCGFTVSNVMWLCTNAQSLLNTETTVLELDAPINICSDLHGQYNDLVRILQMGGMPPTQKWLFLGDYVDRGPQSVEVVCLLLSLKLRYPNHVFLLRGNHETEEISEKFGFLDECQKKMSKAAWSMFNDVFDTLPISAIIGGKYFCIHGGISPQLKDLTQIMLIKRPMKIPKSGLLTDLLWSDPDPHATNFGDSERGNTVVYGPAAVHQFLTSNNLKMIIRGHQVIKSGYDFPFNHDKTVVTLFSASSPAKKIEAAYMKISKTLSYSFSVLLPENLRSHTAPASMPPRCDASKDTAALPRRLGLKSSAKLSSSQTMLKYRHSISISSPSALYPATSFSSFEIDSSSNSTSNTNTTTSNLSSNSNTTTSNLSSNSNLSIPNSFAERKLQTSSKCLAPSGMMRTRSGSFKLTPLPLSHKNCSSSSYLNVNENAFT